MPALNVISTVLGLVYNIMRLGRFFLTKIGVIKRNRKIRQDYKHIEDIVDDGDVDEINKILKP